MTQTKATEDVTSTGPAGQSMQRIAIILCASLLAVCDSAHASELTGVSLSEVIEGKIWAAEDGWGFWSWQANNELCVRVFSPDGECTDSGPWGMEDDTVCYELGWWSEAYGLRKNCFVVRALGDGRYGAIPKGSAVETSVFDFSLIE